LEVLETLLALMILGALPILGWKEQPLSESSPSLISFFLMMDFYSLCWKVSVMVSLLLVLILGWKSSPPV
jgi:hypothetical protein